jgi:hypothetical protein
LVGISTKYSTTMLTTTRVEFSAHIWVITVRKIDSLKDGLCFCMNSNKVRIGLYFDIGLIF